MPALRLTKYDSRFHHLRHIFHHRRHDELQRHHFPAMVLPRAGRVYERVCWDYAAGILAHTAGEAEAGHLLKPRALFNGFLLGKRLTIVYIPLYFLFGEVRVFVSVLHGDVLYWDGLC